ncbi:hypothetical protein EMCRGX_G012966 [Ephydatia muelleri]
MEKIHKTQGTDKKKKKILSSFIERWRETHARLHHTDAATTTDTFFAIMRLLLPELDRARPAYGMKETALAKHYIEVLNISKESTDAQKLLHYRAPQIAKEPHRCSSEPVPGRPSQWQHQQGQGWHEEGPPAPPEEHQCSGVTGEILLAPLVRWMGLEKLSGYNTRMQSFEASCSIAIACFYTAVFLFFETAWEYCSSLLCPGGGQPCWVMIEERLIRPAEDKCPNVSTPTPSALTSHVSTTLGQRIQHTGPHLHTLKWPSSPQIIDGETIAPILTDKAVTFTTCSITFTRCATSPATSICTSARKGRGR